MYLWKIFFVIPVTIIIIAIASSVLRHVGNIFSGESFQYLTLRRGAISACHAVVMSVA